MEKTDKQMRIKAAYSAGYDCGLRGDAPSSHTIGMRSEELAAFKRGVVAGMLEKNGGGRANADR